MCGALRFSVFTFCFCPPREKHTAEMDSTTLRRNHHGAKILLSTSFKYFIPHLKSEIVVMFFLLKNNCKNLHCSINLLGLMVCFGDTFLGFGGDAKGIQCTQTWIPIQGF